MSEETLRLGMCAGEPSGDILGGAVLRALTARGQTVQPAGIGGSHMQAQGLTSLCPIERLSVMGFVEPLKRLPELLRIRRDLIAQQRTYRPDFFLGIDSPDFNLTVERRLKEAGIVSAHLVSPTVWAWRRGRIHRIGKSIDRMLCLLPFELEIYQQAGIDAVCVGHPLVDEVTAMPTAIALRERLGLPTGNTLLAVLPGSREFEVRFMMPLFAQVIRELRDQHSDLHFVVPAANAARMRQIERELGEDCARIHLLNSSGREAMRASDAVLLASGTATLEAMLLGKPMVISYRVGPFTAWLLRRMVHTTFAGLPNILAGRAVVPELLQEEANVPQLLDATNHLLERGAEQLPIFEQLTEKIGGGFADRCADALMPLVKR